MHRSDSFDFWDPFVRELWSSILPVVFVLLFLLTLVPIPNWLRPLSQTLASPFHKALTLHEALSYGEANEAADLQTESKYKVSLWITLVLVSLAVCETLVWLAVGSYQLITESANVWSGVAPVMISVTWVYAALRPVLWPSPTVMFDLFSLYLVHLVSAVLNLGSLIFDYKVYGAPLPATSGLVGYAVNLAALLVLLIITLNIPLGVPSSKVNKDEIGKTVSPEDYCTLWQWISFHWVVPIIQKGTNSTLNEEDVWELSPTNQSRPLFLTFSKRRDFRLLRKLWASNSLDLILDFLLTLVSVIFQYAGPFFLQKILESIDESSSESRYKAYIYAFSAFICTLIKAETDCLHLWFSRRANIRIRSQLMAAIYDKALKRKEFSGVVKKDNSQPTDKKTQEAATSDPKSSADVGKIVNMMSSDANQIGNIAAGAYFIYGAPLEIVIALSFLYKLLGWSAFSGFFVVLVCWPLNSIIAKRAIKIQKGVLAARDKRLGVLNELIGAIKFIKFFAWEDRWISRVLDARKYELDWVVKMRLNGLLFSGIWAFAPILVSVTSFSTFIYMGNQLTVSIAFTAISLFTMIRAPLNILPTYIVFILQAGVSLDRIAAYLDEDEVDEQVSTMKKDLTRESDRDLPRGLGISKGTFKWNEAKTKDGSKNVAKSPSTSTINSDTTVVANTILAEQEEEDHKFELRDISVMFPERRLSVITGPTASGKTALLMALLGEMTCLGGELIMSKNPYKVDENGDMHTFSYAAQAPWLQHLSIKDNILFGSTLDEERYDLVIECCALKPDFDILEDGDATEVGARGVSLSGGQKARVALARAVYARTKYVLLDDPLSAVDSHTARVLFDKLLCGPLLANRTVILVTHHVELVLPGTYYLIRMLDGHIDVQGTLQDLRAKGLLDEIAHNSSVEAHQKTAASPTTVDPELEAVEGEEVKPATNQTPRKLVKDEHRETGSVKWSVYNTYLKVSSYWSWGIILVFVFIQQLCVVGERLWIKYWGAAYSDTPSVHLSLHAFSTFGAAEDQMVLNNPIMAHQAANHILTSVAMNSSSLPNAETNPMFYVGIYAAISLGGGLIGLVIVCVQYMAALRASRTLFKQMLGTVVRATMRWFDTTPQGRLLNRFSKDIETVDSSLAGSIQAVTSSLATFLSSGLVVVSVFPLFSIPALAIAYMYQRLSIGYLNTGRDLRRMESNSRSPIFSGFGELLEGIVTVRAFGAERRFIDGLHTKIDLTTRMFYTFWMLNRHLLLHFDVLGAFAVLLTVLFSLSGLVSAGTAGLCITSATSFTMSIYWACRFWTALELDLNSVERVVEYLDLPQEPPAIIENNRVPAYWPSGSNNDNLVVVENLVIKYSPELPAVLHGVSFSLKAKERVGLLGRTGSGKSTLAQSLLRFVDPESGRIIIDGIDISQIGISDLRSRVTFIPQDATLFSGTLRDNMDPFGEHDDAECLDALYRVHMISESEYQSRRSSRQPSRAPSISEVVREDTQSTETTVNTDVENKIKISLDTEVSAGGSNFSAGQRQLIAMARALLRRSTIIILDEATSSIDFATDAKIQITIREEFTDSLLLTVAHRLRTVIDYDRLVVLDKGEVIEFDTPWNLIQKEDGLFRNMCLKSGMFAELEMAAKAKAASN